MDTANPAAADLLMLRNSGQNQAPWTPWVPIHISTWVPISFRCTEYQGTYPHDHVSEQNGFLYSLHSNTPPAHGNHFLLIYTVNR